ncbi:MAG: hypothetical protein U1E34_00260 [Amaricoccus sp.]
MTTALPPACLRDSPRRQAAMLPPSYTTTRDTTSTRRGIDGVGIAEGGARRRLSRRAGGWRDANDHGQAPEHADGSGRRSMSPSTRSMGRRPLRTGTAPEAYP